MCYSTKNRTLYRHTNLSLTSFLKYLPHYSLHNTTWDVWRPSLATLLPSSRKSSGSNFFFFLLTLWTAGFLTIIFIIWGIFPGTSFNTEIPQVSPTGSRIRFSYANMLFLDHHPRAIKAPSKRERLYCGLTKCTYHTQNIQLLIIHYV